MIDPADDYPPGLRWFARTRYGRWNARVFEAIAAHMDRTLITPLRRLK